MKTSLAFVAVILIQIQIVFSRPSISQYGSNKSNRFEPDHFEFSFSDFSSSVAPLRNEDHDSINTTDLPNEIYEHETYDPENDDDDMKLGDGKYGSDMKNVLKTFLAILPKNTTMTRLFEQVDDALKTIPNEAISNLTIIDQNRKVITK